MKYKMLVMDVDGTLTDGRLYYSAEGETLKAFDVKDGYGIIEFINAGGIPVVITGRESDIVKQRCKELGIIEVFQGVSQKLEKMKEIANRYCISSNQIVYIGDDISDVDCIMYCGFSACPQDAFEAVKDHVDYVCLHDGGRGAVREVISFIMNEDR